MQTQVKIVEKPWGREEWWAVTARYVGKLLYINNGHRLSLQLHKIKEETMRVLSGILTFQCNDNVYELREGDVFHVPPKTIHRMEANYGDVVVIEVSTPEVEDVVRIQDDYSRSS
jgi:mannose-1-phosphate guanylyltransferase